MISSLWDFRSVSEGSLLFCTPLRGRGIGLAIPVWEAYPMTILRRSSGRIIYFRQWPANNSPAQIFRKFAQFLCDLPVELRPLFRITLIVLFTQDTDLEVETVLRLIDSLLKSLFPQILDKFIRVLIRTHIDDFTGKPGLP